MLLAYFCELECLISHTTRAFPIHYLKDNPREFCRFKRRLLLLRALTANAQELDPVCVLIAVGPERQNYMRNSGSI